MRDRVVAMAVVAALSALSGPATAGAAAGSLPTGDPAPGPALLHARPAIAPQLTNAPPWRAAPILVSGASAYRDGEWVYQDYLYDDHGARGERDPGDPRARLDLFSPPGGTYTYPTDRRYAGNAADLVELRVRPLRDATAFRLTLNTLLDPEAVGATLALGSSGAPRAFPYGANVRAPAAAFLTWHGRTADLIDAATGAPLGPRPAVRVDVVRRQVELRVPHSAWDPKRRTVRVAAGVGLWDAGRDAYLTPQAAADAAHPGGAGGLATPPAFFNVAFRPREPFQGITDTATGATSPSFWRDGEQGLALARGDLEPFAARVDFAKLAADVDDDSDVPVNGPLNRILASHVERTQGTDWSVVCRLRPVCPGQLAGRLQPYALYVPKRAGQGGRRQLTLQLHSLQANFNQFSGRRAQAQFADRDPPSIVLTPEARGPDGFYVDATAADVFEAWADVAAHYRLDPAHTSIAGYSMGAFGTFKLAAQFPDLFARAQPTVGGSAIPAEMLKSMRWVPFLIWAAQADELVPLGLVRLATDTLARNGYRYTLDLFAPYSGPPSVLDNHAMLQRGDEFGPAARFLGGARVVRDPPRVTFVRNPALDFPSLGTTADHAYWLSGVRVRDNRSGRLGTIDVRSWGFGTGSPRPVPEPAREGILGGGALGALPYASSGQRWAPAPRAPVRDRIDVTATNIASVRVDATRARVSCRAQVRVRSDGPLRVRLVNCPRSSRRQAEQRELR